MHSCSITCVMFATYSLGERWIDRTLHTYASTAWLSREAPCYVTSAFNGWYIIINITRLNMLITIINRVRGEDRGLVACIKQEWRMATYIMARSKEKQACNCACNVQRYGKVYYNHKRLILIMLKYFFIDTDKKKIKILRFTFTACNRSWWYRHFFYLWTFKIRTTL